MSLFTYSPGEVHLSINGVPATGWTSIVCAPNADAYTPSVSADGKQSRSRNADKSWTVTINFEQTSPMNDVLTALRLLDLVGSGTGTFAFALSDIPLGRTIFLDTEAYIQTPAGAEFQAEVTSRTWVIYLPTVDAFVGGAN